MSFIKKICLAFIALAASSTLIIMPALPQNDANGAVMDAILGDYEAYRLEFSPNAAARAAGRLPRGWEDVRPETRARQMAKLEALSTRLSALADQDTLDTAILAALINGDLRRMKHDPDRLPFTGDSGFHTRPTFVVSNANLRHKQDAEDLITQISAIPAFFEQNIANMRRGIATGYTAYKDPMATTLNQLRDFHAGALEDSPLYKPFKRLPKRLTQAEQDQIKSDALAAVSKASSAYENLLRFMTDEYAPHVRKVPGIGSLPGGKALYRDEVWFHTTRADLSPEAVHEIGQKEVARIRAEMEAIIEEVGFDGTFAEFLTFLRTDPQFYAKTPDELLSFAAVLSKKLDATLPRFFGHLPRLPYGVSPVPAEIAPGYTTGRYSGGDAATGRAGTYLVNTHRLDQRPLYELPALTAHEAVPGHHLQIALARELVGVPAFRRNYYATAFGEGWGLYAERLAGEAGLYETPYERFGALSYEMWRACRLVADTGMHWFGWSRAEGEACFRENSALAELNIKTEVTRYIGWPGQALGYKIGEITIRELRAEAEAELGADFDIRAFHDLILSEGAMPLSLLEMRVKDWISEQSR